MAAESELLSSGKLAEKLNISPAKLKKFIEQLNIEANSMKGKCAYYDNAAYEKIKAAL